MVRSFCSILVLLAFAAPVVAQPPTNSLVKLRFDDGPVITEPASLVVVPDNGPAPEPRVQLDIVARDEFGAPLAGFHAFVQFSAQATQDLCWCDIQAQENWIQANGRKIFQAITDATGLAVFQIGAGGCVEEMGAVVLKVGATSNPNDAVQLRVYNVVASMDNTGAGALPCDRAVDVRDLVEYAIAHMGGPYSPCHDYDGDHVVNANDLVLYARHHVRHATCP